MNDTRQQVRLRPVIRVFVSSTFSDMKHERNALEADAFPKLEQLCQRQGFQFQAIDLRWGVSTEAELDHRTMRICFDELRRAQEISPRPNFLILLGNRYGWRPLPEEISVEEFHTLEHAAAQIPDSADKSAVAVLRKWYREDTNAVPPVYLLQSRRQDLGDDQHYTHAAVWNQVQAVLWTIINRAMPPEQLQRRFNLAASDGSPPAIVRFQASATEQEIWHGALRVPGSREHVLAFFREIENLAAFSDPKQIKDFVDVDPSGNVEVALQTEQDRLKAELHQRLGSANVFRNEAPARLVEVQDNQAGRTADVATDHLAQLCTDVVSRLSEIIQGQIEEYWRNTAQASTDRAARELEIEQREYERFAKERGGEESFVGRHVELQAILDYVGSDSRWPLVIHGTSGCGKTALLARAALGLPNSALRIPHSAIVTRFIGVAPRSSDLRSLLSSLCQELRQRNPHAGALPTEIKELRDEFVLHLQAATPEQPLILFLDALDQLADADNGRLLNWLPPGSLPAHVKLVVSCLSDRATGDPAGQPYAELNRRPIPAENFINLDVLSEAEARLLLFDRWLPKAGRKVSDDQRARIEQRLASPACRQPIFLKLLFEEVRLWHSYDPPLELGEGVPALLGQLFDRLSQPTNHGPLLVNRVLGYLAASRHGLAENEILEILFADPEHRAKLNEATEQTRHELPPNAKRIPIALWSRLRFDLAPYLTERAAPAANVLAFYHRQVAEWVQERFGKAFDQSWQPHRRLADYFRSLADPEKNQSWRGDSPRALGEIVFHLAGARQINETSAVLCNLKFVEARCRHGQVFPLCSDYALAKAHFSASGVLSIPPVLSPQEAYATQPARPATAAHDHIRVSEFARFVQLQCHALSSFGQRSGFCIQQAHNFVQSSAVTSAAKAILRDRHDCLMLLSWSSPTARDPRLLMTLSGHASEVTSVSITPDGARALSTSMDGVLRVWDLCTGECLHVLGGPHAPALTAAISADGSRGVSASWGLDNSSNLRIWDLVSGTCLRTTESIWFRTSGTYHSEWWCKRCDYCDEGPYWELDSVSRCPQCGLANGHAKAVTRVCLSADGKRAVSASDDGSVRLWDADSGHCLQVVQVSESATADSPRTTTTFSLSRLPLSVTPDARLAVVGGQGWDLETETVRYMNLPTHPHCIRITPDGRTAVFALANSAEVWDLPSGKCLHRLQAHKDPLWAVDITPDGKLVTTAGGDVFIAGARDYAIRVWDVPQNTCIRTLKGHADTVKDIAVLPDGTKAVSASADRTLVVWDLTAVAADADGDRPLQESHASVVTGLCCLEDQSRIISASADNTLRVWDTMSGSCLGTLSADHKYDKALEAVCAMPASRTAVCGSQGGTIRAWNVVSMKEVGGLSRYREVRAHDYGGVDRLCASPDGRVIVSAGSSAMVWDLPSDGFPQRLNSGEVGGLSFTPDGQTVVTAGRDRKLRIWDIRTAKVLKDIAVDLDTVTAIAVTPDGRMAVTGGGFHDRTVCVWELQSGRCVQTLVGHGNSVTSVKAMPDGRTVVSAGADKTVRVWDLSHEEATAVYCHDHAITCVENIGGTNRLTCGTENGEVFLLVMRGLAIDAARVTAVRVYDHHEGMHVGQWDDRFTSICPFCGHRFIVPSDMIESIAAVAAGFANDRFPCLVFPAEAWEEQRLQMWCPQCGKQLVFNPFLVDNRQ